MKLWTFFQFRTTVTNWTWLTLHAFYATPRLKGKQDIFFLWLQISITAHLSVRGNRGSGNEDIESKLVIYSHPRSVRIPKLWWDAVLLTLLVPLVNTLHTHTALFIMTLQRISPLILHRLRQRISTQRCLKVGHCSLKAVVNGFDFSIGLSSMNLHSAGLLEAAQASSFWRRKGWMQP